MDQALRPNVLRAMGQVEKTEHLSEHIISAAQAVITEKRKGSIS